MRNFMRGEYVIRDLVKFKIDVILLNQMHIASCTVPTALKKNMVVRSC